MRVALFPTLLALVGAVATALLGNWQWGRAREKAELQALVDLASKQAPMVLSKDSRAIPAQRRVQASGRFASSKTILLDNRTRKGVAGYEVITPLVLADNVAVVVNRGWIAANPDRSRLPQIAAIETPVTIEGLALAPSSRYVELSEHTISGSVWQNLDLKRYAEVSGLQFLPAVIQLYSTLPDGLERNWPRPDQRIDTHRAYALQWYTMSVAILILYLVLHVKRR